MVAHSKERVVEVERFGELRLPLGGKYGYIGVRGKQGPDKDKYQGYTKDKKHTTKLFNEPQEAAVALATHLAGALRHGWQKAACQTQLYGRTR